MRTITIKSNRLGRYDDVSPFLVERGTLELKINLPNRNGEFFLVTELNGKNGGAKQIPRGGTVTLTGLEAGELHAEVKHYLHGELIETYKVEPLLLKAVDTNLSATPEIAFLTEEKEKLKNETEELAKRLDSAEKNLELILHCQHLRDVAFLAYAWAEYQNDLQLNAKSLTLEAFAETLGFSLTAFTEEEIEEIQNQKEKL